MSTTISPGVHDFLNAVCVCDHLWKLGISIEEFRSTPLTFPAYVEDEGLFNAVVNETRFEDELVDRILAEPDFG
jgi:hypothetical protein